MELYFEVEENPARVKVLKDDIPFCSMDFQGNIFNPIHTEQMTIDDLSLSAFLKALVKTFDKKVDGMLILYSV